MSATKFIRIQQRGGWINGVNRWKITMELLIAAAAFAWVFSAFTSQTFSDEEQKQKPDEKPYFVAKIYKPESKKD